MMDLELLAGRSPIKLSGGEQQKVALARVLSIEPEVILLDEPLASIDEESSRVMKEELKRIHRDLKVTLVHVTHNQVEAFSLAERVAVMNHGQIIQVDRAKSLLSCPGDEFIARFLGYDNILKGKFVGHDAELSVVDISGFQMKTSARGKAKEEECTMGIRAEDVSISLTPAVSSRINFFRGIVTDFTDLGPLVSVSVNSGFQVKAFVSKGHFLELSIDRGTEVWVSFSPEAFRVLTKCHVSS
jgi:ABC-type Fe3+/spermidine/putrescine transport system ATPase subunit